MTLLTWPISRQLAARVAALGVEYADASPDERPCGWSPATLISGISGVGVPGDLRT